MYLLFGFVIIEARRQPKGRWHHMTAKIAGLVPHSSVNGPGVRYVVFFQGCPHHCKGCQNPDTWSPEGGKDIEIGSIIKEILDTKYIDGVTLSGGDPFYQPEALMEIAKACKEHGINVWCYTGWTYEEIYKGHVGNKAQEALSFVDVLVDGPFIIDLLSDTCIYRGSSNQRLVDVRKSSCEGKVMEVEGLDFGL